MGGWGSGRSGGRPTVESCLTLDLNELLRGGSIRPMTSLFNATLVWRNIGTGKETSRIGYTAHLEEKSGHMRLSYTVTRCTGEKIPVEYAIQLSSTPSAVRRAALVVRVPPDGSTGVEASSPERSNQVRLTPGLQVAASCDCQRETAPLSLPWAEPGRPGNAWSLSAALEIHVSGRSGCVRKTFDRLMAKVDAADAVVEGHTAVLRDLLFQKTGERLEL